MSDSPLSSDEEVLVLSLAAECEKEKRTKRTKWVHHICASRDEEGEYHTLFSHLKKDDTKFFQYCRMSYIKFCELLSYIKDDITMQETRFRKPISAEERLFLTLR